LHDREVHVDTEDVDGLLGADGEAAFGGSGTGTDSAVALEELVSKCVGAVVENGVQRVEVVHDPGGEVACLVCGDVRVGGCSQKLCHLFIAEPLR